jgi:hypothetical protein
MEQKKQFAPEYAIWEKTAANGTVYLSLKTANGEWITFFKNKFASGKQPQWKQAPARPTAEEKAQSHNFQEPPSNSYLESTDIPF